MTPTTWTWCYEDAAGASLDVSRSEVFTSRGDAESWLGEHWDDLAESGARRAQLMCAGAPVGRAVTLTLALPQ